MKTLKLKTLALSLAVAGAASVAVVPAVSQAGVSANAGVFTDYIWRGMNQSAEGTGQPALQGGLDYEHDSGLFVGTWASTLDTGYEYDLYAGWGGSFEGFDLGAAYTAYMYTEDSKTNELNFEEVNLSAGYGPVSLAYDINVTKGSKATHYAVSLDAGSVAEGMSLTYGASNTNETGSKSQGYLDIGYATTLDMGVDLGVNVIMSDANTDDTTYFVVGLSKSFDLM
jgi:uncharacterized protein (TIGR02001 family)